MRRAGCPLNVGTGGEVGWMRGPCACPRRNAIRLFHETQTNRVARRTGTRPPPFPTSAPCPYRIGDASLPMLVVKVHQDWGHFVADVGCEIQQRNAIWMYLCKTSAYLHIQ